MGPFFFSIGNVAPGFMPGVRRAPGQAPGHACVRRPNEIATFHDAGNVAPGFMPGVRSVRPAQPFVRGKPGRYGVDPSSGVNRSTSLRTPRRRYGALRLLSWFSRRKEDPLALEGVCILLDGLRSKAGQRLFQRISQSGMTVSRFRGFSSRIAKVC